MAVVVVVVVGVDSAESGGGEGVQKRRRRRHPSSGSAGTVNRPHAHFICMIISRSDVRSRRRRRSLTRFSIADPAIMCRAYRRSSLPPMRRRWEVTRHDDDDDNFISRYAYLHPFAPYNTHTYNVYIQINTVLL